MEINFEKIKNNLKSGVDKTAELTVKYTGKALSFTKLKVKAPDTKIKIGDLYKNIGELVYKSSKEGTDVSEELENLINKIDELTALLEENNEELERLK